MSDLSPVLNLPYILPAQAQKHVTHNEALRTLDVAVQLVVRSRVETSPPSSPTTGDCYAVPVGASGAWAGEAPNIAVWDGGIWSFHAPMVGWVAHCLDEGSNLRFDGSTWLVEAGASSADLLGVNTTADTTNRLAVSSPATLFSHEGSDHRVVVNKAGISDTNSLLFQTNWSGRAEMGCAGNDDFEVKVSPDGSSWTTALAIDASSGLVSGEAVQADPEDNTAGRLLRAGAFGLGEMVRAMSITIADDAVGLISPPTNGGFMAICANFDQDYPQLQESGVFGFDVGLSPLIAKIWYGSAFAAATLGTVLTGTTGADDTATISALGDGTLQIENRTGATKTFKVTVI